MRDGHSSGAVQQADATVRSVLAQVVIVSLGCFVAAITLLHWLRPDVNPVSRVTSEYAVGPFGFLMTAAFFAFSAALAALAVGLARALSTPARASAGIMLLLLGALATAVAAFFLVDVGAPRPVTGHGRVHRIAAIVAFASMTLAPLVLARRFAGRPGWRGMAGFSRLVGAAGLLGLVLIQLFLLERGLAGAAQRMILLLVIAWQVAVALRISPAPRTSDG